MRMMISAIPLAGFKVLCCVYDDFSNTSCGLLRFCVVCMMISAIPLAGFKVLCCVCDDFSNTSCSFYGFVLCV